MLGVVLRFAPARRQGGCADLRAGAADIQAGLVQDAAEVERGAELLALADRAAGTVHHPVGSLRMPSKGRHNAGFTQGVVKKNLEVLGGSLRL
jgi:hypothetical protein